MSSRLLARLAGNRHIQMSADDLSDVSEWHALVGNSVIRSSCGTFLEREPIKMSSIEPVHRGPAVETITHIRRNSFFLRDSDETRNKAVIAFAMDRGWQPHD